ncbi:MAG: hypothetical protein ACYDBQ_05955 [Thermoplasmatota archaeon]
MGASRDVKMIQVRPSTHERLTALRLPGLTYEDVINFAIDHISREELANHYAQWQQQAMQTLSMPSKPRAAATVAEAVASFRNQYEQRFPGLLQAMG